MNLELIKNNIIFRLITKKEFDRLTKQSEATKDEFPYRKWNDLYLIYRSILPNQSEDLVTTMLISNFIMKRLKFTEEELFQFAKTNTAKRTGIIVKPLRFAKAADGKATKIIIPSEIQGVAGLVSSVTEIAKDVKPTTKANK